MVLRPALCAGLGLGALIGMGMRSTPLDPTDVLAAIAGGSAGAGAYTGICRALKRPPAHGRIGLLLSAAVGCIGGLAANNYRIESAEKLKAWVAEHDPATGDVYYFNKMTGETTWDKP